jgi:hypothetical protein
MPTIETWLLQLRSFYLNCVSKFDGGSACQQGYSLLGLLAALAAAIWVWVFVRRSFRAWREERTYQNMLITRRQIAPPEVMEQFRWKGDATADSDIAYPDLVERIKAEKSKLRGKASRNWDIPV